MKDDIQNKQFIALELTKIAYNNSEDITDTNLITTYEYFLKNLTNVIDEVDTVDALKSEIERLKRENEYLKDNNRDIIRPFANDIMNVLNGAKGDMEPYVYDTITGMIRGKIQ